MKQFIYKVRKFLATKQGKVVLITLPLLIVLVVFYLIYFHGNSESSSSGGIASIFSWTDKQKTQETKDKNIAKSQYVLEIEKIGVDAPIILDVDAFNEEEYLRAIEDGVAMMRDSSLPGEPGLSFIFGHSRYYKTKPGNYKEVFLRLDELKVGDQIIINSQDKDYNYQVYEYITVTADDWDEVYKNKDSSNNVLTIMTCWPPGETTFRYIVHAREIK